MAQMNYPHAPSGCTPGERVVFNTLKKHLPEDYYVWFEPTLFGKKASARPDFVVLGKDTGFTIIEVKDWSIDRIHSANRNQFEILNGDKIDVRTNPEKQVELQFRKFTDELQRYRKTEPDKYKFLIEKNGQYKGRQVFSISKLVAFPNITQHGWKNPELKLFHMLNSELVLLKEELGGTLLSRLQKACFFKVSLSQEQISILRWMISPETRIPLSQGKLFTLAPEQVGIAKVDTYLPPHALKLSKKPHAMLIRGVVGSGKTLILLFRAKFISEQNPNWRVVILTYNKSLKKYLEKIFIQIGGNPDQVEIVNFHKWCSNKLSPHGLFKSPKNSWQQKSLVSKLLKEEKSKEFEAQFLVDEFDWIKERLDYKKWGDYLDPQKVSRVGRGKGLGRTEREKRQRIYNFFNLYQKTLKEQNIHDWADVPILMQKAMDDGVIKKQQYHAILIDEAQDFAPSWFRVAFQMIKPETNMIFIVGDGAQKIYRRDFTWKELGLGITSQNSYVLKHSYRNTREIINVALDVIQDSQTLLTELKSAGDGIVEAETVNDLSRHGPLPILFASKSSEEEYKKIAKEILLLIQRGYSPNNIVILHRYRHRQKQVVQVIQKHGIACTNNLNAVKPSVKVSTFHSVKGLEFDVVFICGLEEFREDLLINTQSDEAQELFDQTRKLLYVGMTRAKHLLYITHSGMPPKWIIERLQNKVKKM